MLSQAVAILLLANGFSIAVTSTYPTGPPGTTPPAPSALFDINVGVAIAVFLCLAAADHLLTATAARGVYESDLRGGINRFRWAEYSISATIMIVLIGFYFGVTDITAVVAVIGANMAMIFFGWMQERMNPPGRESTTMLPFWFGTVAGAAPGRRSRSTSSDPMRFRHSSSRSSSCSWSSSQPSRSISGCSTARSARGGATRSARRSISSSAS